MLKFLLILFLVGYIFFKVGGFLFRIFLGRLGAKAASQAGRANGSQSRQQRKTKTAGGINIEFVPEDKNKRTAKNFKGGEYVDYEELK